VSDARGTHRTLVRTGGLVDAATVAEYLAVERSWVYEHAAELRARRLGLGPKARLRFSLEDVDRALTTCVSNKGSETDASPAPTPLRRRRRSSGLGTSVDLLPIRGHRVVSNDVEEAS
jgi:hypothetical protein